MFAMNSSSTSISSRGSNGDKRLIDMAKKDAESKLVDLCVDVDFYLGTLDVESKYLKVSTIEWLIAQVKLVDVHRRVPRVYIEVNVRKNTLSVYKRATDAEDDEMLLQHTLTNVFKLTAMSSDPQCFAYFYRKSPASVTLYTLHAFRSGRANLAEVIYELQIQALHLHESFLTYEKVFDFKLVTKLKIAQEELNIPNFIELCLEKAYLSRQRQQQQQQPQQQQPQKQVVQNSFQNSLRTKIPSLGVLGGQSSTSSTSSSSSSASSSKLSKSEQYMSLIGDKRVLLKFGLNRLYLQETDMPPGEHEYRNVLYLNNSITNENFFCLAYSDAITNPVTSSSSSDIIANKSSSSSSYVNLLIMYSDDVELIDDVIREYAVNVSSELNVVENHNTGSSNSKHVLTTSTSPHHLPQSQSQAPITAMFDVVDGNEQSPQHHHQLSLSPRFEQHTCMMCPMQQFVELCDYLKEYESHPLLVYDILSDKLNYNLDSSDQAYLYECTNSNAHLAELLNKHAVVLTQTMSNIVDSSGVDDDDQMIDYVVELNQLMMALIHKLCERKQRRHVLDYFDTKNINNNHVSSTTTVTNIDLFRFIATSSDERRRQHKFSFPSSATAQQSKSVYQNLASMAKPAIIGTLKRSSSLDEYYGNKGRVLFNNNKRFSNKLTNLLFNSSIPKSPSLSTTTTSISSSSSRKPSHLFNYILSDVAASNRSIRKHIFNKIAGNPTLIPPSPAANSEATTLNGGGFKFKRFKHANDIRLFWKKIISEQIILTKMEKEHRKMNMRSDYLKERQQQKHKESSSSSNQEDERSLAGFNYVEITPCLKEVDKVWTQWMSQSREDELFQVDLAEIKYILKSC